VSILTLAAAPQRWPTAAYASQTVSSSSQERSVRKYGGSISSLSICCLCCSCNSSSIRSQTIASSLRPIWTFSVSISTISLRIICGIWRSITNCKICGHLRRKILLEYSSGSSIGVCTRDTSLTASTWRGRPAGATGKGKGGVPPHPNYDF